MLSKEKRRALDILEKTTVNNGNRYEVGLFWNNEETKLPYNKDLALNIFKSTENKLKRNPGVASKYKEIVNSHTESGHARKLSKEDSDSTSNITSYIPHYSVVNPNKSGILRVVYDAEAQSQNTSLNQNLIKGPDFLNNLVGKSQKEKDSGNVRYSANVQ